jgi:hypothetical protein
MVTSEGAGGEGGQLGDVQGIEAQCGHSRVQMEATDENKCDFSAIDCSL